MPCRRGSRRPQHSRSALPSRLLSHAHGAARAVQRANGAARATFFNDGVSIGPWIGAAGKRHDRSTRTGPTRGTSLRTVATESVDAYLAHVTNPFDLQRTARMIYPRGYTMQPSRLTVGASSAVTSAPPSLADAQTACLRYDCAVLRTTLNSSRPQGAGT